MSLTPSTMLKLGTKAPSFDLPSTAGKNVTLENFNDSTVLVAIFTCNHCPYAKHVKEKLVVIANEYTSKDVAFVAINSNDAEQYTADSLKMMKMEAYPFPYLYDETQEVAKAYMAACTPDFYVFDKNRSLVYRGQMDDSRPGSGEEITGEDLINAINATLERKIIDELTQKPSTGCNIKWKPDNEPEYY